MTPAVPHKPDTANPIAVGELTKAQGRFLTKVGPRGLLPFGQADFRVHAGLLTRGLIAITYGDGGGYVLTPKGRALLSALAKKGRE